jgi:hypothetical protein
VLPPRSKTFSRTGWQAPLLVQIANLARVLACSAGEYNLALYPHTTLTVFWCPSGFTFCACSSTQKKKYRVGLGTWTYTRGRGKQGLERGQGHDAEVTQALYRLVKALPSALRSPPPTQVGKHGSQRTFRPRPRAWKSTSARRNNTKAMDPHLEFARQHLGIAFKVCGTKRSPTSITRFPDVRMPQQDSRGGETSRIFVGVPWGMWKQT